MAAPRKDNVKELILDAAEKLLESRKLSDISFPKSPILPAFPREPSITTIK